MDACMQNFPGQRASCAFTSWAATLQDVLQAPFEAGTGAFPYNFSLTAFHATFFQAPPPLSSPSDSPLLHHPHFPLRIRCIICFSSPSPAKQSRRQTFALTDPQIASADAISYLASAGLSLPQQHPTLTTFIDHTSPRRIATALNHLPDRRLDCISLRFLSRLIRTDRSLPGQGSGV